ITPLRPLRCGTMDGMDERSESTIRHVEYKVRGGKLVSVDVTVVDERIATAHVFGDFFLEPDGALEDLNAALAGMPTTATTSAPAVDARSATADVFGDFFLDPDDALEGLTAARVGTPTTATTAGLASALTPQLAARPDPVQLIGFDEEAVAIATRRALGHATSWSDLTFDVIGPQVLPPVLHVALDEVLPLAVVAGRRTPHFRIRDWDPPLRVIGSYQSLRNEIDAEGAAAHGIGVVRRVTGGGAMFMEQGNCITYSLVVPTSLVEGLSFEQSYAYLDDWVMGALAEIGVRARYVP